MEHVVISLVSFLLRKLIYNINYFKGISEDFVGVGDAKVYL